MKLITFLGILGSLLGFWYIIISGNYTGAFSPEEYVRGIGASIIIPTVFFTSYLYFSTKD